jgi:hypothetical protein
MWQSYPEEADEYLTDNSHYLEPDSTAKKVTAVPAARAAEVSNIAEQRAALRKREEAVAAQQMSLQQLIVGVAGLAQHRGYYKALRMRRMRMFLWRGGSAHMEAQADDSVSHASGRRPALAAVLEYLGGGALRCGPLLGLAALTLCWGSCSSHSSFSSRCRTMLAHVNRPV